MARRLCEDELNSLKMYDHLSGSDIVIFYRMPTTEERSGYTNESILRQRNKIVNRYGETRQKYGYKILEGVREGDFEIKKDGKWVPISSDPNSEYFIPDWKKHIRKNAPDILEALAARVFDVSVEVLEEESATGNEEEELSEKN